MLKDAPRIIMQEIGARLTHQPSSTKEVEIIKKYLSAEPDGVDTLDRCIVTSKRALVALKVKEWLETDPDPAIDAERFQTLLQNVPAETAWSWLLSTPSKNLEEQVAYVTTTEVTKPEHNQLGYNGRICMEPVLKAAGYKGVNVPWAARKAPPKGLAYIAEFTKNLPGPAVHATTAEGILEEDNKLLERFFKQAAEMKHVGLVEAFHQRFGDDPASQLWRDCNKNLTPSQKAWMDETYGSFSAAGPEMT